MKRGDTVKRTPYNCKWWVWFNYADGPGCPFQLVGNAQVRYDGVDYWIGKEPLTGLDETGERSAIVSVSEATEAQLTDWFNKHSIVCKDHNEVV